MNYLPVVTTVGQLLASEDEFGEGDGIAVVLCGLSPVIVRDEFAVVWSDVGVEQLHVAVVWDGSVSAHFGQHSSSFGQLSVCTVY